MYKFIILLTLFVTSLTLQAKQQIDFRAIYQHTLQEERDYLLAIRQKRVLEHTESTAKTTHRTPSLHALEESRRNQQLDRRSTLLRQIAMY